MDVHLRGGGLQSGSHEKPSPSHRLRLRPAPDHAVGHLNAATKLLTKTKITPGDQATRGLLKNFYVRSNIPQRGTVQHPDHSETATYRQHRNGQEPRIRGASAIS